MRRLCICLSFAEKLLSLYGQSSKCTPSSHSSGGEPHTAPEVQKGRQDCAAMHPTEKHIFHIEFSLSYPTSQNPHTTANGVTNYYRAWIRRFIWYPAEPQQPDQLKSYLGRFENNGAKLDDREYAAKIHRGVS